jgi:hypothetical protein
VTPSGLGQENTIRYVGHELDGTRDKEEAQEEGEGPEEWIADEC